MYYPHDYYSTCEHACDVILTRIFPRPMTGLPRNYVPLGVPSFSDMHPQQHIQFQDVQKACMHHNKIASDLKIQDLIDEISGELYQYNPVNSRSFLCDYLRGSDLYFILLSFDQCIYFSSVLASSMFLIWIGWMQLLHVSVPPFRSTPIFTNAGTVMSDLGLSMPFKHCTHIPGSLVRGNSRDR